MRDFESVETGEHDIQNHEVGSGAEGGRHRHLTVGRIQRAMAVALYIETQQLADLRVVIDEEDGCHRSGSL